MAVAACSDEAGNDGAAGAGGGATADGAADAALDSGGANDTSGTDDASSTDDAVSGTETSGTEDAVSGTDATGTDDAVSGTDASGTDDASSGTDDASSDAAGTDDAAPTDSGPTCTPTAPPTEVCDGLDNNCDGKTDDTVGLCDDGSACTTDSCGAKDGKVQCQHDAGNDGGACDDGDACTSADACKSGLCAGAAVACDDGKACTDDSCDKATGCKNANNTAACDDGDACTEGDACKDGACGAGAAKSCDDGKVCTDDSCDKTSGCKNANNTAACDDGDACTTGEACKDGGCAGTPKACDDSDACTTDTCKDGNCANVTKGCDDGKVCTDDSCDKATGCKNVNNVETCDDGDACTEGDACKDGACAGGKPKVCDDANVCTDDSCDKVAGCKAAHNTGACDDGQTCTSEACKAGACAATQKDCDDKNACTADSCDNGSGKCVHDPLANCKACSANADCNDANDCTTDTCVGAKCSNAKVPGCLGPPDFWPNKLSGLPAKVDALTGFGNMSVGLAINNLGKTTTSGTISVQLWVATQGDLNGGAGTKLKVSDLSSFSPTGISTTAPKNSSFKLPIGYTTIPEIQKYTHFCFYVSYIGSDPDADLSNNAVCQAIAIHVPHAKILGLQLKGANKPIDGSKLEVNYQHVLALQYGLIYSDATLTSYPASFLTKLSKDAKIDSSDVSLAGPSGSMPVGDKIKEYNLGIPKNTVPGDYFLCSSYAFSGPASWNQSPDDDEKCFPIVVTASPDLEAQSLMPGASTSVGGQLKSGIVFGANNVCEIVVGNQKGNGPSGEFDVRCTLESAGQPPHLTFDWKHPSIAAGVGVQTKSTTFKPDSTTVSGVKPFTPYQWCAVIDPDKKVADLDLNNHKKCITSLVYAPNYKIGNATVPTTIKLGTPVATKFDGINNGSHAGLAKWGAKIVFSTDDKLDASDTLIGTDQPNNNVIEGVPFAGAVPGKWCFYGCGGPFPPSVTFPTSLTPGKGFVLFVVDYTNALAEFDETDNLVALPVTLTN